MIEHELDLMYENEWISQHDLALNSLPQGVFQYSLLSYSGV